jgi:hypothetical protein
MDFDLLLEVVKNSALATISAQQAVLNLISQQTDINYTPVVTDLNNLTTSVEAL